MKNTELIIKTKTQNYSMIIGSNLIKRIEKILNDNSIIFKNCLLVIDGNIARRKIYEIKKSLKEKNIYTFFIKANENNKNIKSVNKIFQEQIVLFQ